MNKANNPLSNDEGEPKSKAKSADAKMVDGKSDSNLPIPAEKKVEVAPKAEAQITPNRDDDTQTVNAVIDGIEYPELREDGEVIVKLDQLLVQNEGRGTVFELALGFKTKQVKAKLKAKRLVGKNLMGALDKYFLGLKLSGARSPRTIQRYVQVLDKMIDDGTLTGTMLDALRAADFTEEIRKEVIQITEGLGINKLYEKYGMVEVKKPAKVKAEKTLERRLMDQVVALVDTYKKLTSIRSEMVTAGEAIDPGIDEMLTKVCDAAVALSKQPAIAAMLKEDEQKASGEAEA